MKAIEKDPRRRYASAGDLAEDLRRYLADEPIKARRMGPLERLGRWGRRNPLVASLTAAIVVVTALGFVGVLGQWQVAVAHEQQANQRLKALNEQLRATQAELRSTLYVAHMNLANHALEETAVTRALELLDKYRPKSGEPDLRGFEWHYLDRLCHRDLLLTIKGHTRGVVSIDFCLDGKRLVTSAGGGTSDILEGKTPWCPHTGRA
jgi:hypothetical protein